MAGPPHLLCASLLGLLFKGLPSVPVAGASSPTGPNITLELKGGRVLLRCGLAAQDVTWSKDGRPLQQELGRVLDVGAVLDDPRGSYECRKGQSATASLQVFFRSCQNCIQVDAATLAGLLVASLGTTAFLALAVSRIAAQEPGRLSRASDRQTLLANDQLYQLHQQEWKSEQERRCRWSQGPQEEQSDAAAEVLREECGEAVPAAAA
ncbi:hypothetical protein lerEdw1_010040 [Lerista edwardsae]|nr:hypothetical protein lerEdw1_010040 [Lerista edwardsae]